MRFSIFAAVLSLVLGAMADPMRPPPPPPPGSACNGLPDTYPKGKVDVAPIIIENQRRNLGVTSLPRKWVRDLLSSLDTPCPALGCACVKAGQKAPYGFFKMSQCPVQHGASYYSCSVEQDGFKVR